MTDDEQLARDTYEFMRERYGKDAFHSWDQLHQSIRDHFIEQVRMMHEAGLIEPNPPKTPR